MGRAPFDVDSSFAGGRFRIPKDVDPLILTELFGMTTAKIIEMIGVYGSRSQEIVPFASIVDVELSKALEELHVTTRHMRDHGDLYGHENWVAAFRAGRCRVRENLVPRHEPARAADARHPEPCGRERQNQDPGGAVIDLPDALRAKGAKRFQVAVYPSRSRRLHVAFRDVLVWFLRNAPQDPDPLKQAAIEQETDRLERAEQAIRERLNRLFGGGPWVPSTSARVRSKAAQGFESPSVSVQPALGHEFALSGDTLTCKCGIAWSCHREDPRPCDLWLRGQQAGIKGRR